MRGVRVLAWGLALASVSVGCNNGNGAPVAFGELPGRLGASYCSFASRCGYTALFEQGLFHSSITDCPGQAARYFEDTTFAQYDLAIDRGTIVYHPENAGACLAAFDGIGCGLGALSGAPPGCRETFEGRVADGGACTLSEECSETSSCTGSGSSCGMCFHQLQIGESCTSGGAACASGSFCTAGVCTAQVGQGGACDPMTSEACRSGLSCVPNSGDPSHGTCMAPPTAGPGEPCAMATCATGLVCAISGTSATCRAPRTDGTCEYVVSGTDCAVGTVCNATSPGMPGACVPYPVLASPCTTACAAPARCVNMVCQPTRRIGETCASSDECLSSTCTAGVCVARPLCTP